MREYKMTMTGDIDSISQMLVGLLEKQNTGFNLNYKMKIDDLGWSTFLDSTSRVSGKFRFDRDLERRDLRVFEETYKVKVGFGD